MRALLVRVGIDQAFGKWNAPVDPATREFVYVPIPDKGLRAGLETPYLMVRAALDEFASTRNVDAGTCELPEALAGQQMHLDPDFSTLTYGDTATRGKALAGFEPRDIVVFYAGLRPCRSIPAQSDKLTYAIIGLLRVREIVRAGDVERARWNENAHTRRNALNPTDVIIRGEPGASGRLRRCLPIGELRDRAYRVRRDLLKAWGDLSVADGYIHRSANPPRFLDPARFMTWFAAQEPELLAANNPIDLGTVGPDPVIIVHLRQPRVGDKRTDPLFEFGSFGLTGCHRTNLLASDAAAGCRLAFAQGGPTGFRLVMLTPRVDVRRLASIREAFWPGEMPLRYDAAPLLVDNQGNSDVPGLISMIGRVDRGTVMAQFSSAFRSRKKPLPRDVAAQLVAAWNRCVADPSTRASAYWEALPRWDPDTVDRDRAATYEKLRRNALGESDRKPRRC